MSLSSLSIRRPVFTTVLTLVIMIFGFIGMNGLGVREYPQSERPIVTVSASYPGANAAVIENQITKPLEEEINTVAGIVSMRSTSREGQSHIQLEFELGDDIERAANDIRDRVSAAVRKLPKDADPPVVTKADADGEPIVFLNIGSNQRNAMDLTQMAVDIFKARFETISGVGRVDVWGSKTYSMRLWIDPDRLSAYQLSPIDVRSAFEQANIELPSGRIEGTSVDLSVRTESRIGAAPEEFLNLVIKRNDHHVVRFRDIGEVVLAPVNERSVLKRDGVPMVGVVLRPQADANQIEIVDEFYRRLEEIKKDLPEDILLGIGFDTSIFVRKSIAEVQQTIFMALALVCLTIFLFLREVRSALIPMLTIPISLIGGFFILYIFDFSINVLTLLAMVLAVGLVVDDAVIVLENIYSKIEAGMQPAQAAVEGTQEIFAAVIATTLALAAVFTPIIFMGGLTGTLFREFGLTLAGIVVISSFIALTLTPMLCSKILKRHETTPWFYKATEPIFVKLNRGYQVTLNDFLRVRWMAFPIFMICFAAIYYFFISLQTELAPREDRSLLRIEVKGPEGVNYEYMATIMDSLDSIVFKHFSDVSEAMISVTSPGHGGTSTVNSGFARYVLKQPEQRSRSQENIAQELRQYTRNIPGTDISVRSPGTFAGGGRGQPLQFIIENQNFHKIKEVIPAFLEKAKARKELTGVDVDLVFNNPELSIEIDRNRSESLGVPVGDIANAIQAALSGQRYGYFLRDGRQYEIIGQLKRSGRKTPDDLSRIQLRSDKGRLISLDNLARLKESGSPPILYRYNRFASASIGADYAPGYSLGDALKAMRQVAKEVLDETFSTDLAGEAKEMTSTGRSLAFVFALSLILVYLVLSAQFESFRSPFIIMTTVPLALAGGLFSLWLTGQTINLFSQIGLIMLIGLVTKNGILVVEFANQRLAAGLTPREAASDAAAARFRPILMTTISTILGTLPIALAIGSGAKSRIPLGVAVIGGLAIGSILTLYVIPAIYTWAAPKRKAS